MDGMPTSRPSSLILALLINLYSLAFIDFHPCNPGKVNGASDISNGSGSTFITRLFLSAQSCTPTARGPADRFDSNVGNLYEFSYIMKPGETDDCLKDSR